MSIQFPASKSLCNDLAKASEALDGKKNWVCFWCVFCFLFFVFRFLLSNMTWDLDYVSVRYQFTFAASYGPCTSQLINLICNMLGNMLNDLAEAIRRWTEKKM